MLAVTFCIAALLPSSAAPAPKAGPPRLLVVSSNRDGNWEVYLVQPGTGELKNLTNHKADDTEPAWSPDGKRIAFVSDRGGTSEIWVINWDGGEPKQLTEKSGGCTWLRWSPDGKRIAFASGKRGPVGIYTADTQTGTVTQFTDEKFSCRTPAWSPDGKKLAYSHSPDQGKSRVCLRNADGTGKRDLIQEGGGHEPVWSPDGKQLAFVGSFGHPQGLNVFTINADGKNLKQLTITTDAYVDRAPQWSPDGSKIAYGDMVDGALQVAVMNVDGSGAKVITLNHLHAEPRWSPDGKSISYTRCEMGNTAALFVSDADGENPKELIDGVGLRPAEWKPK